jgi:hypothetical protein
MRSIPSARRLPRNRPDDPEHIVCLIGQVITLSLESVRLVRELSALPLLETSARPEPPATDDWRLADWEL